MSIPLPKMLREHRRQEFSRRLTPPRARWALMVWAYFAKRPELYRQASRIVIKLLNLLSGGKGRFRSLLFAQAWTAARDLPAPQGDTFMAQWKQRKQRRKP